MRSEARIAPYRGYRLTGLDHFVQLIQQIRILIHVAPVDRRMLVVRSSVGRAHREAPASVRTG